MSDTLNIQSKETELRLELSKKNAQLDSLMLLTEAINKNAPALELFELFRLRLEKHFQLRDVILLHRRDDGITIYKRVEHDIDIEDYIDDIKAFDYADDKDIRNSRLAKEQGYDKVLKVYHKTQALAYLLFRGDISSVETLKFIRTLTNIIAVAIENKRLFQNYVNKKQYQKEMELAKEVQKMLVPSIIPETPEIIIDTRYIPHSEVSGDYYDYINLDDRRVLFCIADVSGKGVPAALQMANIQASLRRLVITKSSPKELAVEMNKIIYKNTRGESFVTMFIAIYDVISDTINYVNAGHNPPILICNKSGKHEELNNGCTVLGAIKELKIVEEVEQRIQEDSTLILYTDGLTEVKNRNGELYGVKRLKKFMVENKGENPKLINLRLEEDIKNFRQEVRETDDITIMTCLIKPEGIKE